MAWQKKCNASAREREKEKEYNWKKGKEKDIAWRPPRRRQRLR